MNTLEVIGLGALNVDYIYRVERLLKDEETVAPRQRRAEYEAADTEKLGAFPGGSAANTIFGLAKLGVKTGFCGAVGDDADGKTMVRDFERAGVDISQIKLKPKAETGSTTCLSDKLNFRSIQVRPGANSLLSRDDLDLNYINRAGMLHLSSFADNKQLEVILKLLDHLDSSAKLSFSPGAIYASKGLKRLAPILSRTNVLFLNEVETRQLTNEDFTAGARRLLDSGCRLVVVTLGQGTAYKNTRATSYIRNSQREYVIEAGEYDKEAEVDTTGAGDALAAGFLYGLLRNKGLEECGRLGDITARFCIAKIGAREGLPTLSELSKRYQELYNKKL